MDWLISIWIEILCNMIPCKRKGTKYGVSQVWLLQMSVTDVRKWILTQP